MDIKKMIQEELNMQKKDNVHNFRKNSPMLYKKFETKKCLKEIEKQCNTTKIGGVTYYYETPGDKDKKVFLYTDKECKTLAKDSKGYQMMANVGDDKLIKEEKSTKKEPVITPKKESPDMKPVKSTNATKMKKSDPELKSHKKDDDEKKIDTDRKDRDSKDKRELLSDAKLTDELIEKIGKKLGIDWTIYSKEQFKKGMKVEKEHDDLTHGDPVLTAKIVMAHLKESPQYYVELSKMEKLLSDAKKSEVKDTTKKQKKLGESKKELYLRKLIKEEAKRVIREQSNNDEEVDFVTVCDNELHVYKTAAGKYYFTINSEKLNNKLYNTQAAAYSTGERQIEDDCRENNQ